MSQYNIGVFASVFSPPHKGHFTTILEASCQCKKLYVVVSHNSTLEALWYKNSHIKPPTLQQKILWLNSELSEISNVTVIGLDETNLPINHSRYALWGQKLKSIIPELIDAVFISDECIENLYKKYLPMIETILLPKIHLIASKNVRKNLYSNWEQIMPSARCHYSRKILVIDEFKEKNDLIKRLSKRFTTTLTSNITEKYLSERLYGNTSLLSSSNLFDIRIAHLNTENQNCCCANKITFSDADSLLFKYKSLVQFKCYDNKMDQYLDSDKYDLIFIVKPEKNKTNNNSERKHHYLLQIATFQELVKLYQENGLSDKIVILKGTASECFNNAIDRCNEEEENNHGNT
jgi:NadR type nicotinamide-nucleotide adenylyltransferase